MADADPTARLIAELTRRQLRIAVAESLTGGLLTAELTRIPGASLAVSGGVVAYDTAVKGSRARRSRSTPSSEPFTAVS